MIVSFRDSVEIDKERRFDIFALAGKLEVYQNGMRLRDTIKALMAKCGTSWATELENTYPADQFKPAKSKRRTQQKRASNNGES